MSGSGLRDSGHIRVFELLEGICAGQLSVTVMAR